MSVSVKHLNADTAFYLTFSPSYATGPPNEAYPGSFTILIDPWLSGPSKIWTSWFSISHHVVPACVDSITDLPPPDIILISQDKSDHCHKETLLQLPSDSDAIILGTKAAAKKIQSWKYFNPASIFYLLPYQAQGEDNMFRVAIPPVSKDGAEGEVTISLIAPKPDITGLHNAFGITYRAPSSVLTAKKPPTIKLQLEDEIASLSTSQHSRPFSPTPSIPFSMNQPTTAEHGREKAVSIIYTPHGVDYSLVKAYAETHLMNELALPLSILIHSFDRSTIPWYLGGNVCAGSPSGMTIARNLYAKTWISAHDEDKIVRGVSVINLKVEKHSIGEIKEKMSIDSGIGGGDAVGATELVSLDAGEVFILPAK